MREPITLIFGEQNFQVRPLTLGQLEQLEELFAHQPLAGGSTKVARAAIKIALSRSHAEIDVNELECDVRELPRQMEAIMRLGGFVSGNMGEAPAAAGASASNGAPSEAES